jgi:hypothetical protein
MHPDALELAAYAEGTAPKETLDRIDDHLAACDVCRAAVAAVGPVGESHRRARRLLYVLLPLATAAALVLAILLPRTHEPEDASSVVAALKSGAPGQFADFRWLSDSELSEIVAPALRGGVTLLVPQGTLLDRRPDFRWRPVAGITEWTSVLRSPQGDRTWGIPGGATLSSLPAEAADLEDATEYAWILRGDGPLGRVESERRFRIASPAERDAYARARASAHRLVSPRWESVVVATWALRHGLVLEALHVLDAAPSDSDPQTSALRARLRERVDR